MLNMTIKDLKTIFFMYRSRMMLLLAIPIVFTIANINSNFFSLYMLMGAVMILAIPEMEARDKVNILFMSTPCKRKEMVFGRFFIMVVWIILVVISGVIINSILSLAIGDRIIKLTINDLKVVPVIMILLIGLYYFVYFTFSYKIAKVWYFISFILVMMVNTFFNVSNYENRIYLLKKFFSFANSTSIINNILYFTLVFAVLGILVVLSSVFYEKKDF